MKHLTERKLPRFPRRARRAAARRTLAALLCAATLGGAVPVLAAGEGDSIPSTDIPAAQAITADTEAGYFYYWHNARNGGMPTAKTKDTKIPVLIVWNEQYYLRGDSNLKTALENVYPQDNGRNCAAMINRTVDNPKLAMTTSGGVYHIPTSEWPRKWLKGTSNSEDTSGYLVSGYGGLYLWRSKNDYYWTKENIGYSNSWKDNIFAGQGQGFGGCSMWRTDRHYGMQDNALVKNLELYRDLKQTGYAMTDEIQKGMPFLLDFGGTDANNHSYAIGWEDDTSKNGQAHFLYGAFFVRASYNPDGAAAEDPPPSSDWDRWWKTCDWYAYYGDYTPEQWASTRLNISRSTGRGTLPTNTELKQRTWDFSMSTSGQFSISTAGTFHTRYEQNYYNRNDASGGNCWDQDRVVWLQLCDGGHINSEGWLFHSPAGERYGTNWLRYSGDYLGYKTHTSQNKNSDYLFDVYVGDPQICSYLKNSFTVQAGQTVNIDGPVVLKEGNTITVEDGGVLSVSGWFINNGTVNVKRGGKLIVQHRETTGGDYQEGLIDSLASAGKAAGGIKCDGTMIVMSNATVIGAGVDGLRFGASAQVVNYGTLAAENFEVYRDNTIENRGDTSRVFCGWGVVGNGYGLTRTKNDGSDTFADMGRREGASSVSLAADAVYGQRASAVFINSASQVNAKTDEANRTGGVTGAASGATGQKIAARVVDFDPAEWEKHYLPETKKAKV